MDPPSYPVEAFPLNWGEPSPTQPPGPPMVPYTTVNISTERPPRDHIIWSLISFLHFNPCCLGLAAVIYSFRARDSKMMGDFRAAESYGNTARIYNIGIIVLFLVLLAVTIYLCFYRPLWRGYIAGVVSSKVI